MIWTHNPSSFYIKLTDYLLSSQVYVRRAYIAYELNSVQHRQLRDNTCIVEFQFMLPTSHPNRYHTSKMAAMLTSCASSLLLHPSNGTVDRIIIYIIMNGCSRSSYNCKSVFRRTRRLRRSEPSALHGATVALPPSQLFVIVRGCSPCKCSSCANEGVFARLGTRFSVDQRCVKLKLGASCQLPFLVSPGKRKQIVWALYLGSLSNLKNQTLTNWEFVLYMLSI